MSKSSQIIKAHKQASPRHTWRREDAPILGLSLGEVIGVRGATAREKKKKKNIEHMASDISLLLAQVEAAVSNLEASAQTTEINASPTAAAAPAAVWTFDDDPIPTRKRPDDRRPRSTTGNEARYCLRKEKRKREPFVTPAPGHYDPCHEAVLRKPSGIKMVRSCTKRRQMPIANNQGNSQSVLHTQEDLGKALAASSRVQKPRGGRFGPEKGPLDKRTSRPNRLANGPGVGQYNPSHRLVEKRTTGPSFAAPGKAKLADYMSKREIRAKNEIKPNAETVQETFMPSLERAYRATEARVKGVTRWQSATSTADIYKRPKSPSEEPNEEETILHEESVFDDRSFDPLKAWLASKPKRGAVAWVPTSYRKPPSPMKKDDITEGSSQQVRLTSGFCAPSSSFAKPVEQSKQLIARNARQTASAAKLGPGAHFDESTFTSFQQSRKACRDESTKTNTMQSLEKAKTKHRSQRPPQETPGVGTYDTQRAFTLTQSRVPGGSSSFKGPPRWPKPQGQPVAVQEDLKPTKTEDREEATAFAVDASHSPDADCSSTSSERSQFTDEGKRESKCFDIDEYDSAETSSLGSRSCTSYSSSSSADSNHGMEGLAQHFLHKKPSSWARKPFMVEADARRALILQRHMRRKASEKRGPARLLHLNQEAVEPRRNTHVVSMERAEAQRAKQRAANEAIRDKIKAASATRADQILEALGVDLDAAEMQADALAMTPDNPSKIKGFTYREPAPLPPQALEAQMRRELENMYRGPGTYEAATTHREWITDEEDNRPALMSRATGRERVSVRQKGALRTIAFTEADFQQQDPDLAALGPGRYQVSSRVSRFGVEKSRAPDMDRMNASSRFEKAQELDNHAPILELDAASAKEKTKKKAPGAAGYAFSKLPSNRQGSGNARQQGDSFPSITFGSGAGDEAFLDLEPDREKFKYKRTQELVPMDKLPQRFSPDKRGRGDRDRQSKDEYENEHLALDPERGLAFLRKRSRAANMSMGSPRNLLPVQFQDEFGEGDEELPVVFESEPLSRNLDAVKPRVVRHVPDFAKAPKRFPDEESESKANQSRSDYDVDAGLRITKPRQASESATVDMQRQRGRFDDESREADRPRYLDADYAGAEKGHDCLGGRNAKGAQRRGARSSRTLVNMAKSAPRQLDAKDAKEKKTGENLSLQTEELVLDPSRADAHVRPRHIRGVLGMDKSQPRWADTRGNDAGKGLDSPNLAELEKGMAQLSMLGRSVHPAPKGHVNMGKQPGRQIKEAPPDILSEIDARAARDAPSQNLRVVGGVIPAADDRAAPMSAHARALAEQGNVLELNPDPTPLLKRRAAGTLAMETQTGRSSPVCDIHSPGVLMASPIHPDVRASEHFLKPRVIGGAVGLETDVPKPILTHRQEERAHEERTFKVNQAGKNAQLRKAIRSERKQAVARARGDKENDSGKQRRTRPPRTTKVKSGKTIPRAQKVL